MYIQCTKAMLDKVDTKKTRLVSVDNCDDGGNGFYSWHVHYLTVNRKKVIVCMNNLTRYTIVLYRPKPKDIVELEDRIKEGVRAAFKEEGVPAEMVEAYIRNCGTAEYSKTAGRNMVASLNKMCETVRWYEDLLDEKTIVQSGVSLALGNYLVKCGETYVYSSEELFRACCKMENRPEREWEQLPMIENYQIKINLMRTKYDIWRRIMMPYRCTFAKLHWVLQETCGGFDYHLHEFSVIDEDYRPQGNMPLHAYPIKIRIVDGENPEAEDYLEPDKYEVKYDTRTSLKDVFRRTNMCIYTYDFGDDWDHEIRLEKVVEDSNNRFPKLLERQGERPPEDVGGEGGFEAYMEIISDPKSPEYDFMIQWAESTRAEERTIEEINRSLKYYY